MNKVSIIIPYFNTEKYIFRALDSILFQSYTNIEIILVDDGSFGNTKELLYNYLDKITYVKQHNKGVSAARNKGFSLCIGEFVIFFDADDVMPFNFINERVNFLKNNIDIDFVCSKMYYVDTNEQPIETPLLNGYSDNLLYDILFYNKTIGTCLSNYLIRKKPLEQKAIGFNENLFCIEDKFFLCELAYCFKGAQINNPEAYLHYRIHDNNMSGESNYKKLIEETRKMTTEFNTAVFFKNNPQLKHKALQKNYLILAKSYFKTKNYKSSIVYLLKLFKSKLNLVK